MFTGSFVYSTISNQWDKELGEFNNHFAEARGIRLLDKLLNGVMPFVIRNSSSGSPTMFFIGKADSLLAVSYGGIINSAYPEIFRLTVLKNKIDKFDLVYQATSSRKTLLLETEQSISFEKSFILLKDLDSADFEYYGWSDFTTKVDANFDRNAGQIKWYSEYSGLENKLTPEVLKVKLVKDGKNLDIVAILNFSSEKLLQYYLTDESTE
jgi:hypothetical protein